MLKFIYLLQGDGVTPGIGLGDSLATDTTGISEGGTTESLFDLVFYNGAYVTIPLLIMSIIAIYIFVERFLTIRRALREEKNFMMQIKNYMTSGNLDAAKNLCATTDNPMARMVAKGISRIGKPVKDIATSIENVGKVEVSNLENKLPILAIFSGAAPMLGFLGTVIGMMKTFHEMEAKVDLKNMSGGMKEAMVTTVAGLIVGIIAYVAYNYLVSKVSRVIHKMESTSIEFLDILEEPGK